MLDTDSGPRTAAPPDPNGDRPRLRSQGLRAIPRRVSWVLAAHVGVPFFLAACLLTYYGQLHRVQSGDTYGTVYAAVALVRSQTVFLDEYLPHIQARAGEDPYMLTTGRDGHVVNGPPLASSLLAVPAVALFSLAGADPGDFDAWMEAAMLTAAIVGAASVALLFLLLTRLTTRGRAALIAGVYAWGTLAWGINAQALWQHGGAACALVVALLGFVDRRYVLAGAGIGAMVAIRPSTPVLAVLLLPLLGLGLRNWARFVLGAVPFAAGLALYNWIAFASPVEQGYGTGKVEAATRVQDASNMFEAAATLLVSPGRGLFVYSPVLLFALAGAVLAFRTPLYRWCALAFAAYPLAIGNLGEWTGNESFGPRKLAEALPLLAVLLVPALAAVSRSRAWTAVFAIAVAWSVFVEILGAAMWPPPTWFGEHEILFTVSTWWSATDNELVAMLQEANAAPRTAAMLGLLVAALAAGVGASALARRPRLRRVHPAPSRSLTP